MTISENLADILLGMDYKQIPSSAVSSAKKLLLDHFCVAAVGRSTSWAQAVSSVVGRLGGVPESSVYFTGAKLPAMRAAFVNGTYAHGFELDDHGGVGMHAGAVVIPAALATGQRQGIDGRAFITAMVAGYEVGARLSTAMGSISEFGFHPTGTMGALPAAAAAGKVLGLDREQFVSALGLAGNFPTGVKEFIHGTQEKRVFAGRASESGILSCLLAAAGITGARTIFEGEFGFCRSFSKDPDLNKITQGFGEQFLIDRWLIKRYPCAGAIDPYIEAATRLHQRNPQAFRKGGGLSAIAIAGSRVNAQRSIVDVHDVMAAQYSIPYAVCVTLRHGRPAIWSFSEEAINGAGVQTLLKRCEVGGEYPGKGRITVRLADGTALVEEVIETQKRVAEMDQQEVIDKGIEMITASAGAEAARELVQRLDRMVSGIEDAPDIRKVMEQMPVIK
ncbi:MAG: MmgE/PrpD family protein [Chloroflexi bacterium]|nr:MmgE/PrpD family protein [Chloroflexota bacterium]